MLDRAGILRLIPHGPSSCLLDRVESWSAGAIRCSTEAHLDPANPLRRDGCLATICGAEFGLQAAALHGGLRDGAAQQAGYVAALRAVSLMTARLDDPAHGRLIVTAALEQQGAAGLIYGFALFSAAGVALIEGRGVVALPRQAM